MTRASAAVLISLTLAGCIRQDLVDQDTRNRIAVCSAGIGLTLSAGLRAELAAFEKGGTLSAEARQEIRGAIFGDADLGEAATTQAFDGYLACIRQETALIQYIAVLENRRTILLADLQAAGLPEAEVAAFADLTQRHIAATRTGNLVLASDLYRQITLAIAKARQSDPDVEDDGLLYMPS